MQKPAFDQKHPDAKVRVGIDWSDFVFDDDVTIVSSSWDVNALSGVTFSSATIFGVQTSVRVDGGIDGEWAYIKNTVTLSDGRVGVFVINMRISDGVP